jgi:hypothetical protein
MCCGRTTGKDQVRVHLGFNSTLDRIWVAILKQLTDWTSSLSETDIKQTKVSFHILLEYW